VHGAAISRNRWERVGFVAGGTGVAPAAGLLETLLNDPEDTTEISLVASHSLVGDALLCAHFNELASKHDRFLRTHTAFSGEDPANAAQIADALRAAISYSSWTPALKATCSIGRVDPPLLANALPPPADGTVVFVCGTDGFVDAMAGPVTRELLEANDDDDHHEGPRKHKVQGPTLGILGQLGYRPEHVFKL